MEHRAFDGDAAATELGGGDVDVCLPHGEREMLLRNVGLLLENDHAVAAGTHEDPRTARIAQSDLETEHVTIKRLGRLQVPHLDRDLVHTTDGRHGILLPFRSCIRAAR